MFVGTIAALGNGICMPLMALLFGELIDATGKTVSTTETVQGVYKVSLKFVYLALGSSVASFIQMASWTITGEAQATRIRSLYFETILRHEIGFFDKETSTGEIVGRMSGDSILIQDAMGEKVGKFVQTIAAFFGGFVIAFMNGWLLTLIMLSVIPPIAISGAVMFKLIGKLASHKQTAYSQAATTVEQTISSIRTVASYTREQQAISKYNISLLKAYKSGIQEGLASGLTVGTALLILSCGYALAVWLGGKMILEMGYRGGNVIIVIFGVLLGSMSIGQASPCLSAFAAAQAAGFKIFETINRKPEIDAYDANGQTLAEIRGDIELRNVIFSYPARPDEKIFDGFSLSIPSGTTTALVGPSGSGKSTVISLIERFYDPQAGEVLIDGVNLREFQLRWIRKKIGLVSQEPVLFTSSIGDNIAYGKLDATNEETEAAAELANASNFINKLPQGLDTMVGEHGIQLSVGQKQRVAIARAILKDPRILLLDEATSSLDAESERLVQGALDRVMINRTTLIVSHRLTTLRNADMIVVIHQGKIVEKGSRPELLKDPHGAYSQLIRLQGSGKKQEHKDLNHSERDRRSSPFALSPSPLISISGKSFEKLIRTPASEKSQLSHEVALGRLARLNSPEIPILLLGSIFAIANGAITPIFGTVFAAMIRTFYEPKDELTRDSKFWALAFMVLGVASFLTSSMSSYYLAVAGCKLIMRIRSMCFEKVVYMEIGWFDEAEHSSGAIGSRLSSDAASVRSLVGDTLSLILQNTATAVSGLVIAFKASWRLSFLILAVFPLLAISSYIQLRSVQRFGGKLKQGHQEASQVVSDAVSSIRTVASFCAEEKVMQLYKKKCEVPIKAGIKQGLISGLGFGISFFFFFSVYAVSFYVGGVLVDHGKATFSEFFNQLEFLKQAFWLLM
ncbi:ABC transporter B family member 21-like [Mangifera indica]|uniref:ABC transporter B family member 21-like n=1 Tax=Mangifera indica TaxID=29780 RepID=UPI001CFB8AEC|nr:ABC transporter B family member 21-like [Mangifera indica]